MIGGRSPAWPRERSEWPKKQPALSVRPLPAARRQVTTKPRSRRTRRDSAWTREKRHFRGDVADPETRFLGLGKPGRREQPAHESLSSRATLVEVPLTGLSFHEQECEKSYERRSHRARCLSLNGDCGSQVLRVRHWRHATPALALVSRGRTLRFSGRRRTT